MAGFSMEVPDIEEVKTQVAKEVQLPTEQQVAIYDKADENVNELVKVDLDSLENKRNIIATIDSFGSDLLEKSKTKNDLLQVRMGDLSKIGGENGQIIDALSKLDSEMKELDPSGIDFTSTGFLGKLINPIKTYFARYKKADAVIDDIIQSLELSKNTLLQDNTTLEIERQALRDITKKINGQIELALKMDDALVKAIENLQAANGDAEKIKFLQEEILFPLRQKIQDLQQVLTVDQQGIIAMDVIRKNNKELVRAVDRARDVTVSALRVAVTVAGALYHQKIVLEKINALNATTNHLITGTARMLKEQGAEIQKDSMEANVSPETLKQAFADTFAALDQISEYKQKALPQMKATILTFQSLSAEGERHIQNIEKGETL